VSESVTMTSPFSSTGRVQVKKADVPSYDQALFR
jgi:hypothetical protein